MWDIAPQFKAMVVFAEHRFYGKSMPYGNLSYSDAAHMDSFTSEQALADYAVLIAYLKSSIPGVSHSSVIAFGGSYGGMLAAWFRIKYPHVVQGALAASAPVLQFEHYTPCDVFNTIVTKDFALAGDSCPKAIRRSWDAITRLAKSSGGLQYISQAMHLCKPLKKDAGALKSWLTEVYGNLAMANYPYPASFLSPMPAWPIKAVCSKLTDPGLHDKQLIDALFKGISVYFNYTGAAECLDVSQATTGALSDEGWGYQACTEMTMPFCADGVNDMFEPSEWNLQSYSDDCYKKWHVRPRPDWVPLYYGGYNITASSNIIFSNGKLDPWSGGGILKSLSDTLVAIIIDEGAHHLDLRASNKDDPPSVIAARKQEVEIIRRWLGEAAGWEQHAQDGRRLVVHDSQVKREHL
ncbi:PREDICTED: lysosomal Pro-X carboxypeptidase-like isoform X2 [Priapulus caudatus]|nr:PREDICTED: lysosomal Pro-X carboxypeptidase-like isoform X2 [Priapulus caudatus]